ncbi:MAG: galactose mutarotase [Thermoguttaceae bacterium]|nr:galactose mutarotase [Thermoguttaceae bacterium]
MKSLALLTAFCAASIASAAIEVSDWGKTSDGKEVKLYTMTNDNGMVVKVSNFGAVINAIIVPDKDGNMADVALGFDEVSGYEADSCPYFGALVGRYGNRIADGKFTIDGKTYQVTKNENGITCLHGGKIGFNRKIWNVETKENDDAMILKCTLKSPNGEEGFPGNLDVIVHYILPKKLNSLVVLYGAKTDKATPINLTQHCYFNLKGAGADTITDHVLTINADKFTPVNETLIPTGDLRDVEGTPFDFRKPTAIGERIGQTDYDQIKLGNGYDHNWVLNKTENVVGKNSEKFLETPDATLYEPTTGRVMDVYTTEPGIQFYAGNFLDGTLIGKGGKAYQFRSGMCLETQHFPNSPNTPNFPSTILKPGEEYRTGTVFRFGVKED